MHTRSIRRDRTPHPHRAPHLHRAPHRHRTPPRVPLTRRSETRIGPGPGLPRKHRPHHASSARAWAEDYGWGGEGFIGPVPVGRARVMLVGSTTDQAGPPEIPLPPSQSDDPRPLPTEALASCAPHPASTLRRRPLLPSALNSHRPRPLPQSAGRADAPCDVLGRGQGLRAEGAAAAVVLRDQGVQRQAACIRAGRRRGL